MSSFFTSLPAILFIKGLIGRRCSPEETEDMTDLTLLYEKGEQNLRSRKIGFTLGAVETGWIPQNDRAVLDAYTIRQRAIDAPASASTDVTVLGVSLKTPVIMSAMTMPIPSICDDGLIETAQGLARAGSLMWTGTPVPDNLNEIVRTGLPVVQNVKPYEDRDRLFEDVERIQEAGVTWVGIEIDAGQGTKIGDRLVARNCTPLKLTELIRIRNRVTRPLVFKGILSGEDARRSLDAGADAIVVSNHGAHTLDYLPHPLQVMEEILQVVERRIPVIVDGGFRRGSDVLKALALGAELVGLGRPVLYGLAADGALGVYAVIHQITEELKRLMIMTGSESVPKIRPDCLVYRGR